MLLDTASLYYRAFYGMPETVTAPDGTPVNAIRGLLDAIDVAALQAQRRLTVPFIREVLAAPQSATAK